MDNGKMQYRVFSRFGEFVRMGRLLRSGAHGPWRAVALRGVSLAVVPRRSVIFPDRLRRKRQHLQVRMDNRRPEHLATMCLRAVAVVPGAAVFAGIAGK